MLREDGPGAVDHGVGRRALLAEVHHRVGLEALERLGQELKVADVADLQLDVLPADLAPPALSTWFSSCPALQCKSRVIRKVLQRLRPGVRSADVADQQLSTLPAQLYRDTAIQQTVQSCISPYLFLVGHLVIPCSIMQSAQL